jgi:hypothetical protein
MGKVFMYEIISNALPEVVAPEVPVTDTKGDTGATGEPGVPIVTSEVAKPKQTAEDNAAFAAMRRQLETERKEKARLENLVNGFKSGLKPQGYDGNDEDIVAKLNAEAQGVSVDEYKAQYAKAQAEREKQSQAETELEQLRREKHERQLTDDLNAIKAAFPDIKAKSVWELGDKYVALMRTGEVDALTAYRAIRDAEVKPAPPSIGSVKSATVQAEKEFYTSDEVDRLTPKQLDDPKIMKKVMASMTKWNK